ncbi:hypothetical protein [Parvularcula lutaonensis]|uniref:Polysaccharide chain length determinant protein, PEP-CTERM locus subfamily n=1 Tax=Parvularcula lutaonensis TaxID=491923 RepID=A0ABV7M9Z8_9PROT|nr:hypothetical protein [Parvularcula lutaonensis]GGY36058.1 hypothetical protein GCM10007148_00190 [Parvularcula lutaonensis]
MERYSIGDLIKLGLRRFFWVFIPFCVLLTIGLIVLNEVPARYQSTAVLMVEDQQVSQALVPSAIRSIAQDRLQTIRAEMRARNNIVELGQEFQLFDRDSTRPFSQQVDDIRNDIRISIQSVNSQRNRRNQQPSTITFEIGFVHENPQTAFRVANKLVTDFLAENVESRIEAVEGTAEFFREEERDLRRQIENVRKQIADVREANPGRTPSDQGLIQAQIARLTTDIARTEERIEAANQDLSLLRMQQPIIIDANERADAERIELRNKRRQLAALRAQYTDNYPEVILVTNEVLDLEARLEPAAFERRAARLLSDLNRQIAERDGLSQKELAELRERRDTLQEDIARVRREGGELSLPRLQFEANERRILANIEADEERLEEMRAQLAEAEQRLAEIPAVAAVLNDLASEEQRLLGLLSNTQAGRATVERSETLETQQKAERVIVVEPPALPDVPSAPDKPRAALLLTGVAGGLAAAIGLAPIFLFPRVDTGRQLGQLLPGVAVVEVPEIVDEEEAKFRRAVFLGLTALSIVLAAIASFVAYKVLV